MTLGSVAAAGVRLIVWGKVCSHQVEPGPAEMAARYNAEPAALDWREKVGPFLPGSRQMKLPYLVAVTVHTDVV